MTNFLCSRCGLELNSEAMHCSGCGQAVVAGKPTTGTQTEASGSTAMQGPSIQIGRINQHQLVGIIGSAALFFAVLFPIFSVPNVRNVTYLQWGKGYGIAVLILAITSFILALRKRYKGLWITGLVSATIILYTLICYFVGISSINSRINSELAGNPFIPSFTETTAQAIQIQWGWALLVIGTGLLIYCASRIKL
jgi:hypothetical protein